MPQTRIALAVNNRGLNPTKMTELSMDSGLSDGVVRLDFQTSRGQTVTLSEQDWRTFVNKVDEVISSCKKMKKNPEEGYHAEDGKPRE